MARLALLWGNAKMSYWLLSPLNWLLLALLFGGVGLRLGKSGRWLKRAGIALGFISIAATTPMVGNGLVGWLEAPQSMDADCLSSPPEVAVVLAGGVDALPGDPTQFSVLGISSRRRVEQAVAWWHARPGRSLIMSGGPQYAGGVPTGALMGDYARRLGVSPQAVQLEGTSISTRENARALARLQPSPPRRVALVTSAMHMPRSRYAMARAGFEVCAVPADPRRIPFGLPGYLIPRSSALLKTEAALHELVGIAYYRWLDWRSRPTRN